MADNMQSLALTGGGVSIEGAVSIEATKGINSYYLTSDGGTMSYRTRIRTPTWRRRSYANCDPA